MKEALEILGIHKKTAYKAAYQRYRYLVRKYHPDKGGDAEICAAIIEAWETCKGIFPKRHLKNYITLYPSEEVDGIYLRWFRIESQNYSGWMAYKKISEGLYKITSFYETVEFIMERLRPKDFELRDRKNCWIEIVDEPSKVIVWNI